MVKKRDSWGQDCPPGNLLDRGKNNSLGIGQGSFIGEPVGFGSNLSISIYPFINMLLEISDCLTETLDHCHSTMDQNPKTTPQDQ